MALKNTQAGTPRSLRVLGLPWLMVLLNPFWSQPLVSPQPISTDKLQTPQWPGSAQRRPGRVEGAGMGLSHPGSRWESLHTELMPQESFLGSSRRCLGHAWGPFQ